MSEEFQTATCATYYPIEQMNCLLECVQKCFFYSLFQVCPMYLCQEVHCALCKFCSRILSVSILCWQGFVLLSMNIQLSLFWSTCSRVYGQDSWKAWPLFFLELWKMQGGKWLTPVWWMGVCINSQLSSHSTQFILGFQHPQCGPDTEDSQGFSTLIPSTGIIFM